MEVLISEAAHLAFLLEPGLGTYRLHINTLYSNTGMVLAPYHCPEVQPGPHQIFGTVDGTEVFSSSLSTQLKLSPYFIVS